MRLHKTALFLSVLALWPSWCAAADLELSLAVQRQGGYVKPFDKTITVRRNPLPFSVIITNRSSSSALIYWKADAGGIVSLSFEIREENGDSFVIKHRKKQVMSETMVSNYLGPGESVARTVVLDPDEWENVPGIEPGTRRQYSVRAVFDNNGTTLYSDYYTLIIDRREVRGL